MSVVLSQPAILIFRLTTSQKESITDDQSSCEGVFASKMRSGTGICAVICRFWCHPLGTLRADTYLILLRAGEFYFIYFVKVSRTARRKPVLQTWGGWEEGLLGPLPKQALPCGPWCGFGPPTNPQHGSGVTVGQVTFPRSSLNVPEQGSWYAFVYWHRHSPCYFVLVGLAGYSGPKPFGWLHMSLPQTWN